MLRLILRISLLILLTFKANGGGRDRVGEFCNLAGNSDDTLMFSQVVNS